LVYLRYRYDWQGESFHFLSKVVEKVKKLNFNLQEVFFMLRICTQ
jgi:hypothetical protein